jgi:hypothetical protein
MSRVYLHNKYKYNSLIKVFLYLFIPFIIYGLYKNGIYLYNEKLISFVNIFRPLYFILISIVISFIFSRINKKEFINYELLFNIIIAMIVSPSINILLFIGLLFILNLIYKFIKFNIITVFMIISIIISYILKDSNFYNIFEKTVEHNYSLLDYIIGRGYGGVSNTFLIMSIISFIILCSKMNYKKQIPIMGFSVYYILTLLTSFITGTYSFDLFLNNNLIFAFIFIAPISLFSPYSKGGCYIYGLILGLLTYILSFIDINIGIYITILLLTLVSPILDKFIVGKSNKGLIETL